MTDIQNTPWLTIIGISPTGYAGLSPQAQALIKSARFIIASKRQLDLVPETATTATREQWPSPMLPRMESLKSEKPDNTVILATGDPYCWGIAEYFANHLPASQMQTIPAPSIVSLICAKMSWPSATTQSLSLCSQPIESLARLLEPGKNIITLSATGEHPSQIAKLLNDHGYESSTITVLENLGTEQETITQTTPKKLLAAKPVSPLNSLAIALTKHPTTQRLTTSPGLPDTAFEHDGQLTKQNIRAITLAHLRPSYGERLWDIGCGNGSISIEWLRAAQNTHAIGIEQNQERAARAKMNAENLGVPHLDLIEGKAPECLEGLKNPDAIFIGGGISTPNLLETALQALSSNGRLVANTVTLEGQARLLQAHQSHGGSLTRLSIEQADPVGTFHGWRPQMPITQWVYQK